MAGINFFEKSYKISSSESCVFISHSSKDKYLAKIIANSLLAMSIHVYFDENDTILRQAATLGSDEAIVKCIENGLDNSTHLLGIITNNTKNSWWVSYEIGGAKGRRKQCAHLVSPQVEEVPSFIRIERTILDLIDLNKWAGEVAKTDRFVLKNSLSKSSHFSSLEAVMPESRVSLKYI